LHCEFKDTGSPDIISVLGYQVLHHPSEHGTSLLQKQLLTKGDTTQINELTQVQGNKSASSMVDETALAILN